MSIILNRVWCLYFSVWNLPIRQLEWKDKLFVTVCRINKTYMCWLLKPTVALLESQRPGLGRLFYVPWHAVIVTDPSFAFHRASRNYTRHHCFVRVIDSATFNLSIFDTAPLVASLMRCIYSKNKSIGRVTFKTSSRLKTVGEALQFHFRPFYYQQMIIALDWLIKMAYLCAWKSKMTFIVLPWILILSDMPFLSACLCMFACMTEHVGLHIYVYL